MSQVPTDNRPSLRVNVVGAGSWGGTIAQHLASLGHSITGWHADREEIRQMSEERTHPYIQDLLFDEGIQFIEELSSFEPADIVILSVPAQAVRKVVGKLRIISPGTVVVNVAKGIENNTLLRMSEVILEAGNLDPSQVVTLSGPSHAEEVARRIPTTVVAAGVDKEAIEFVQNVFSCETFRVYTNTDIIGVELGGSVKNVIAIAAGVCDGIGFGDNTKAALITRGIVEIKRLAVAMGAQPATMGGLSGVGDLVVTCLSRHSRNRHVGEQIGKGRKLPEILQELKVVAEGVTTADSIHSLMKKYDVEMPICLSVYNVLFEDEDPRDAVRKLMTRELGYEHPDSATGS